MDLYQYAPQKTFSQEHLLTLQDYTEDEIYQVLALALKLKEELQSGIPHPILQGKSLAMIFTKSSTRTRVSFEVGMQQLGGHALFLSSDDIQLGRGEPIADTARVLSRFVDGIMIRTYDHADVENLARYGSIPVINGLTDSYHPCQVLADLMTVYEHKKTFRSLKMAFIGDGFNMAHSLMIGCSKVGMDIAIGCPKDYMPDPTVTARAEENALAHGSTVLVTNDPVEAVAGADVVYTDVWSSMGQEDEFAVRAKAFAPFQVNDALMVHAKSDALFLHCLPAHRGEEVTASVIDGPLSVVFDEAENRLHAQKAVMALLMGK
jgi:ornithine carbamoyltransferase